MHPLEQPAAELGLPSSLPEVLYCKCKVAVYTLYMILLFFGREVGGCGCNSVYLVVKDWDEWDLVRAVCVGAGEGRYYRGRPRCVFSGS